MDLIPEKHIRYFQFILVQQIVFLIRKRNQKVLQKNGRQLYSLNASPRLCFYLFNCPNIYENYCPNY